MSNVRNTQEKRINYNLQQIALEKCCLVLTEKKLVSPANYLTFFTTTKLFSKYFFSFIKFSHISHYCNRDHRNSATALLMYMFINLNLHQAGRTKSNPYILHNNSIFRMDNSLHIQKFNNSHTNFDCKNISAIATTTIAATTTTTTK